MIDARANPPYVHDERAVLVERAAARWPAARPFLILGSVCIVLGGMVAAITRPTGFVLGSWTAAFLVLVGGTAQIAFGVGQSWLSERPPHARRVRTEVVCWNAAVAGTVVGTVAGALIVTTGAGLILMWVLGLFIATTSPAGSVRRSVCVAYCTLAAIVLVSIPIGLGLAWNRHP